MESKILLGRIIQRFNDLKTSEVESYNRFGYIRKTENAVYVYRENEKDTKITVSADLQSVPKQRKKNNKGKSLLYF